MDEEDKFEKENNVNARKLGEELNAKYNSKGIGTGLQNGTPARGKGSPAKGHGDFRHGQGEKLADKP